jgi:hypothetical protein
MLLHLGSLCEVRVHFISRISYFLTPDEIEIQIHVLLNGVQLRLLNLLISYIESCVGALTI